MTAPTLAAIGIGSNQGDRAAAIDAALAAMAALPSTRLRAASEKIETAPVGAAGPAMFLNSAAVLETELSAHQLLTRLLDIERRAGRQRAGPARWGPRILDLDLLLFGSAIIDAAGLCVPHPRMHQRRFVLAPLASVAPTMRHPRLGKTVAELLANLEHTEA